MLVILNTDVEIYVWEVAQTEELRSQIANVYKRISTPGHCPSGNSSVGRAPDCRGYAVIGRSLVRIRVAGSFCCTACLSVRLMIVEFMN